MAEGEQGTTDGRLAVILRSARTVPFCAACLAFKLGTSLPEAPEALSTLRRFADFKAGDGQCSVCVRKTLVICAIRA